MTRGYLTTHVLDTARGCPAPGIEIALYRLGEPRGLCAQMATNADGRTDRPVLERGRLEVGNYEFIFSCGAYLSSNGLISAAGPFLGDIPIRFEVSDADAHYHVPLLLSPYGYTTYRGS